MIMAKKIEFHLGAISEALFDAVSSGNAVSSGKITSQEYDTACKGLRIINKVVKQ